MPSDVQSVLAPAGTDARTIAALWWVLFWTTTAVTSAVLVWWALAIWRATRDSPPAPERRLIVAVVGASVASLAVLVALLGTSVAAERKLQDLPASDPIAVEITGHRWWWEVHYWPDDPVRRVVTANELHVPVGREVRLRLSSADVIHSFWVPAADGKVDLVPGRDNTLRFRIDQPGTWLGQCAEFCGLQHAYMRLPLVAQDSTSFEDWLRTERAGGAAPGTADAAKGRAIFESAACVLCHTVGGTDARGRVGPDLTHIGRRLYIAAGVRRHSADTMQEWIRDPQRVKPGNEMPVVPLSDEDVRLVTAYMEALR
jgi:cytochrome c oxidase subunit 2